MKTASTVGFERSTTALEDLDGAITSIDVLDTRRFGEPFDDAAAARAVERAREQLSARAIG